MPKTARNTSGGMKVTKTSYGKGKKTYRKKKGPKRKTRRRK